MGAVKLLHTSDLHLDMPFENFSDNARRQRRRDLFAAFSFICELAVTERAQGLLITGDLFHTTRLDRHTVSLVVSEFMRLGDAQVKVIILPGNHDSNVEQVLKKNAGHLPNVHIFSGEGWQEFTGIEGISVFGYPYREETSSARVLKGLLFGEGKGCRIGMLHGTLHGLPHAEGGYFPVTAEDISSSGFDYLALGHFHNFRDCSAGRTRCFYPGSPERLNFSNLSDRKVVLLEITGDSVSVVHVKVPARPYLVIDHDLGCEGLADLYLKLNQWSDNEACVKVTLTGITDEENLFTAAQIREQFKTRFLNLEVNDQTGVVPVIQGSDKTLRGLFIKKLQDRLAENSLSPEEKVVLKEALRVGLKALEGGRLY